jgi:ribosomal protein S18 acetylase RimI-like enzyme
MSDVLPRIERYYDAVPRSVARTEEIGALTLFVNRGPGWNYYARPSLGADHVPVEDVVRVRERQRELGVPEAFEWVLETTPSLGNAAREAGLRVHELPLLGMSRAEARLVEGPPGVSVRLVDPARDDMAELGAVAQVGFMSPGTDAGAIGLEAVAAIASVRQPELVDFERERLRAHLTVMAVAMVDGRPVGVGSHQPVGEVSEVVGVATLPAFRRRGIAAALTSELVRDALKGGAEIVFLSAGSASIARVYERAGFRRIATACLAEPMDSGG